MIWPLIIGACTGLLVAEAWAWWRTREQRPRHANPQPKHTFGEWLHREPIDLDKQDKAAR